MQRSYYKPLIETVLALAIGCVFAIFIFFLLYRTADAAVLSANSGTLESARATTGDLTNLVQVTGNRGALWITCSGNTGTVAWTIQNSPNNSNYAVVTFSGATNDSLTFADVDASVPISNPTGFYKVNLGTCTGCGFSCFYRISDE